MCSCLRLLVLPLMKASGLATAPTGTAWRGQAAFGIFCWLEVTDLDHFLHRFSDVTIFLLSHVYLPLLIVCVCFGWFCPSVMYCVKFCDPLRRNFGNFYRRQRRERRFSEQRRTKPLFPSPARESFPSCLVLERIRRWSSALLEQNSRHPGDRDG
jgi:hypothetical protein